MNISQVKEMLKSEITPDGNLSSAGWYLYYCKADKRATLDGEFTADQLEAVAVYMRNTQQGLQDGD